MNKHRPNFRNARSDLSPLVEEALEAATEGYFTLRECLKSQPKGRYLIHCWGKLNATVFGDSPDFVATEALETGKRNPKESWWED